ncbi:hypothetical protein [Hydrogenophaga sp. 5NK40-0174]|uniref:hypothetical protein n=1 Tax=Hydrogenophaga sp. 5NK40-0174 TaxID=3127649 RepID=UPI0031063D8F
MVSCSTDDVNTQKWVVVLTTEDHAYTMDKWPERMAEHGIRFSALSWEHALTTDKLPKATYVLTDFDRLSFSEMEAATHLYQWLKAEGLPVLNDPGRFLPRAAFLKTLHSQGINSFNCVLPSQGEKPCRYPVFLRTLASHRGVLTELLHDSNQCDDALADAMQKGFPISDLGFIEYAAAPVPETGHFQKLSAYRLGPHIVRANTINDTHWMAKTGISGLASDAQYEEENREMTNYPLHDFVMDVFERTGTDFGRMDFGRVNGRYEVYEINTNPYLAGLSTKHNNAHRSDTLRLIIEQLIAAFAAIGTPVNGEEWVSLREQPTPLRRL